MWILPLIGYAGAILGFCFLTLAIASGLYYLSELVEEHTVIAKRLLTRLIYTVIGVQVALWLLDGFPFWSSLLGVVAHVVYLGNMRRFPFVRLSDPLFLLSCVLVLLDHWVWFRHFSHSQTRAYQRSSYYDTVDVPSFTMIASYFGLCVWLVPFALFVSLSAGDNVLPTMGTEPVRGVDGKARPQGMVKAVVDWARGAIGEIAGSTGLERP
ncbi:transmembrane adaptor Erv26 [Purpureocillium lilacinum]|uniref:Transmembrane adaptor Erv26 n=2 Tax=Purpureocillium lilacinum TaxID=33203 RepID=A0A179HCG0_PURLI|nr:transmembrane adaptor Erv26 [Purpureocillium lilacinum]OAQ87642.1 transmembrane adaptor Erv26 [Purpureocillium lilacinum]OAQ95602.1 transmembrane adaptor Erv26 [Purpureocillium lilacinum]GJN66208.1 erv26 super protein [Purpureocillium lilacinum]GJN80150.1 erv26 super protein [Purpureocillium lilacinum]